MFAVHDYSHLSPEEARRKVAVIANRIFAEQFHRSFFVRDPRPEYYLKYEIHAYLSGTIREFHGWTDPVGQALDFVYSRLTSWFWSFWYNTIKPGIEWIMEGFRWIWDSAVSWARSAYNKALDIWNRLVDLYNYIKGVLYNTVRDIWNKLLTLGAEIYARAREAINIVWTWLQQLWHNYIKPGVEAIVSGFRWIWVQTLNFAQQAVTWAQNAYNGILKAWDSITTTVSGLFETLSRQVAALPQAIAAGFQSAVSFVYDVLKRLWDEVLVPFGQTIRERVEIAAEWFINTVSGIFDELITLLSQYAPTTPEKAWNLVKVLLPVSIGATVAAYAPATVSELFHPLKRIGLTDIVSKVLDSTGISALGGFIAGAVVGHVLHNPLKYYLNSIFRSTLPSFGDAHNLLGRYAMTEEEFKKFMGWYGIPDKWYWVYSELGTSPSPTMTLRYYARYVGLDRDQVVDIFNKLNSGAPLDVRTEDNWFLREMLRMGRSVEWMKAFTHLCLIESTRQVRDQYAREILKDYEYGLISKDELEHELRAVGYPETQRTLLLQFADVRSDRADVIEHIKALQFSYRRGKITLEEFAAGLANLGLREDKIERLVAIEKARAKEEVGQTQEEEVRAYGRGTVIKRFREGIITEKELVEELKMLGYSDQWIERLKQVARLERDYDFAMTVLRYVKTAYRKKKIDDTRFIEILRSYGFTDEKIELELSLLKLAYGLGIEEEEVAS
jgi:hypothetical protein